MSESLAEQFFPKLYEKGKSGGDKVTQEAAEIIYTGVTGSTALGVTAWERLNARDPETGAPVGYLAIKRDELFAHIAQRVQKMVSRPYGRRMQFAQ